MKPFLFSSLYLQKHTFVTFGIANTFENQKKQMSKTASHPLFALVVQEKGAYVLKKLEQTQTASES